MEKKIRILPNGPYEVTEHTPLKQAVIECDDEGTSEKWLEGKCYPEHEEAYHLCRCGRSSSKPYCDGTHTEIGFEGREVASKRPYAEGARRYEGEQVDLLDNESLCSSLRFCERALGVWDAAIASDNEANCELAVYEAACCAAGRLTVVQKDGTPIEPDLPQEIALVQDTAAGWRGPLWVKGGIALEGADGEPYEVRNRMTLCRCGESGNMPYCDTSHLRCTHMEGGDI